MSVVYAPRPYIQRPIVGTCRLSMSMIMGFIVGEPNSRGKGWELGVWVVVVVGGGGGGRGQATERGGGYRMGQRFEENEQW